MKKKLLLTFAILLGCVGFAKADVSINSRNFPVNLVNDHIEQQEKAENSHLF